MDEVTIGGRTVEKGEMGLRDHLDRVKRSFGLAKSAALPQ